MEHTNSSPFVFLRSEDTYSRTKSCLKQVSNRIGLSLPACLIRMPNQNFANIPASGSQLWPVACQVKTMKKDIHPKYQPVVFLDSSSQDKFLIRSTMTSKETIKWEDGNEYPLIKVDISSYSHPFYTGQMKYVDTAGRVEKFQKKYNWAKRGEKS